jgi:hypothetical protein
MIKLAVSGDPKTNQILLVPVNGTRQEEKGMFFPAALL